MIRYYIIFLLFLLMLPITVFSQNPFATLLENPPDYSIDDQDVQSVVISSTDSEIQGSLGIGIDIPANYNYGFDTFVLAENNLRIYFNDTSNSASFPTNDWRITINETTNGGDSFFGIDDATAGTSPFRVMANAGNNALFIEGNGGNIGMGTNNPVVELQIADGDTPTMRLEQNGDSGFTPQTWDIAGNESNFFIRDVTNGSLLPFRIQPAAPTGSLTIGATGSVGIGMGGTAFPNVNASIDLNATDKGLQLNRLTTVERTTLGTALGASEVGVIVFDTDVLSVYTWDGVAWSTGGTGGTDNQMADVFQLTGNNLELSLEDDGVATQTVDLSGYLDNTDDQNADVFQLTGNSLELSLEDDGVATQTVDLSGYLDNTDDQGTDVFQLTGNNLELSLEDDGVATQTVDLSGYLDNTDDQNADVFQLTGNNLELSLEDDGVATQTVDLSGYLDNTDDQGTDVFQLTGNNLELSLEDDGVATQTVDLSGYLDNTDNQNIAGSGFAANMLTIGISGGTSQTVDLSALNNSGTDDQQLTLAGNNLNLEDGGSVSLLSYLDNTDNQNIAGSGFAANMLTIGISGGTSQTVDLSALNNSGTDDQQLSLAGNNLNLEDGGSVSLSSYLDNTDNQNIAGSGLAGNILTIGISGGTAQTVDLSSLNNAGTDDQQLSLAGNTLSLEDGGNVNLSGYLDNTDNQSVTEFSLAGTNLKLLIENTSLVQVDIAPILLPLEIQNVNQQMQIDDLISRIEVLEGCACNLTVGEVSLDRNSAYLLQNVPNPFDNTTVIGYNIPFEFSKAEIIVTNTLGQFIHRIPITTVGEGVFNINRSNLSAGVYLYSLYINGKRLDTKRMLIE